MKLVTVVGARPQFVKAATVSRAIVRKNQCNENIQEFIVHTGQHYDQLMSDVFFEEMNIPKPSFHLGIGGGTHGAMTGRQLEEIEKVLLEVKPDCVLVYGDTNSTIAGALAAAKLHIPIAHVEAGLRSFNMKMPEEVNRILTDQISSYLFCPSEAAIKNLANESIETRGAKVFNVGDVMYDAALYYAGNAQSPGLKAIENYDSFALATMHRAENTDNLDKLKEIISGLNELTKSLPVVLPIHPRTRKIIEQNKLEIKATLIEPVSYFQMLWLIQRSKLILTDSGGLQKEAYFFKKACVTLREQTEWIELLDLGVNKLVGSNSSKIVDTTESFLSDTLDLSLAFEKHVYGEGKAAESIVELLSQQI